MSSVQWEFIETHKYLGNFLLLRLGIFLRNSLMTRDTFSQILWLLFALLVPQFTPFHRACSQGHGDVLEELLRPRPLSWGKIKRMYSFEEGDESIGGDLGDGYGSGGHEALPPLMPSLGIVPTPLSFTIDLRNHFNATPLHRAAAKGHAQVRKTCCTHCLVP